MSLYVCRRGYGLGIRVVEKGDFHCMFVFSVPSTRSRPRGFRSMCVSSTMCFGSQVSQVSQVSHPIMHLAHPDTELRPRADLGAGRGGEGRVGGEGGGG